MIDYGRLLRIRSLFKTKNAGMMNYAYGKEKGKIQ